MCGIVGYYHLRKGAGLKDDLPAAVASLAARGPDDAGCFVDPNGTVGLGHRRLSIIDLSSAGHQPMISDDGMTVIVFNGEIYNFPTLKSQLRQLGHAFASNSDTEVILNAYRQWGTACLDRFVGMFAFAIWDRFRKRLFLARDRLGIKPLYYAFTREYFLFGSELKSLMAFRDFEKQVDHDAFLLYLHYQYIPAPRTIFKDTYKLEPGHFLIFDGTQLMDDRWWALPAGEPGGSAPERIDEHDALVQLDGLLTQSISDRLISDVPLGALLSGGIDSSLVVAIMQRLHRSPVKTFSIGFEESAFNEAHWAAKVAAYLKTDHTELLVTPRDALQVIPQLPEIYDEPFADASSIPSLLVSRLTRDQVTVALSGDGGDEQFAGYARYWITQSMKDYARRIPRDIGRLLQNLLTRIPVRRVDLAYAAIRGVLPPRFRVENFPDKWQKLVSQLGYSDLADLYRMAVCIWSKDDIARLTGCTVPSSTFDQVFQRTVGLDAIRQLLVVDQQTYLPDAMLTKVDRASMAASLEIRVPLIDHRVVEFTSRLPVALKIRNGEGKYLLKALLCRYVPRPMIERPKMGFGVPIAEWLRRELKELVCDYLAPERLKKEGWLDPDWVRRILEAHQQENANHQHRLWTLLMWEMWREKWNL